MILHVEVTHRKAKSYTSLNYSSAIKRQEYLRYSRTTNAYSVYFLNVPVQLRFAVSRKRDNVTERFVIDQYDVDLVLTMRVHRDGVLSDVIVMLSAYIL